MQIQSVFHLSQFISLLPYVSYLILAAFRLVLLFIRILQFLEASITHIYTVQSIPSYFGV